MSGWNWLHAGLEVATYAKARKAQQGLEEMQNAAAKEEARRILLEAMRNFIFDISRDIELAEEQLAEHPQQVFIISRSLDWRLDDSGLSAEIFPEFQDKEYVSKTEKKIAEVIVKSKSALTDEQIEQSEKAVQFICEMPLLQQALVDMPARESLQATESQWQQINGRQKNKNRFLILGIVGLSIFACSGIPLALGGLGSLTGQGFGGFVRGLLMIAVAVAMAVGVFKLIQMGIVPNSEYAPLHDKRKNWEKQLVSDKEYQRVKSTFGKLSSEQFKAMYDERLAFLKPILGNDFQSYLAAEN